MDFGPAPKRPPRENIVPMINVVFLLLIFFLMSAQIAPPDPFEIVPPQATGAETPVPGDTLFVAADGSVSYAGETGDGAWAALAGHAPDTPLMIRADGGLQGSVLAAMLPRLAGLGLTDISLITGAP